MAHALRHLRNAGTPCGCWSMPRGPCNCGICAGAGLCACSTQPRCAAHQVPFQCAPTVRFSIQGARQASTACLPPPAPAASSCRVISSSHSASLTSGWSLRVRGRPSQGSEAIHLRTGLQRQHHSRSSCSSSMGSCSQLLLTEQLQARLGKVSTIPQPLGQHPCRTAAPLTPVLVPGEKAGPDKDHAVLEGRELAPRQHQHGPVLLCS